MKTVKMSLATIQGKLSRGEMKNIMAGSGDGNFYCHCTGGGDMWTTTYASSSAMMEDINARCGSAGGTCTQG